MPSDLAILIPTWAAGIVVVGLMFVIFIMMQTGALDSHFGRNVFPMVAIGGVLVWLVYQFDPRGLSVAGALWMGTIVAAAVYGAVLDLIAWMRGDYG